MDNRIVNTSKVTAGRCKTARAAARRAGNCSRHHDDGPQARVRSCPCAAAARSRSAARLDRSASPPPPCTAAGQQPTTDVKRPQQTALPRPSTSAGAPLRRAGGDSGPGGDPSGPGPGPGRQPEGPGGPGGGGLPFRLRYWILLLAEYGGLYGTAAVVLGALAHVDALGGMRWDSGDVALGLGLMAPVLLFDAMVGLPDWSTRGEDAKALVSLFVDPQLLAATQEERQELLEARGRQAGKQGQGTGTSGVEAGTIRDSGGALSSSSLPPSATTAVGHGASAQEPQLAADTSGVGSEGHGSGSSLAVPAGSNGGVGGSGPPSSALWATGQRLRMAMELMQESSVRNNPGARLTSLQEAAVIAAGVAAEEMLYRAVLLTLLGRWLRDRAYEAGAEETILLGGRLAVDTDAAANWAALALGLAAGAAVFAAKAWQETTMAKRLRAVQATQREELAKEIRKQRLMGQQRTVEELQREAQQMSRLEAAQSHLASSIGVQGALVWALEGSREEMQVAAAGASFLLTGNLAAPVAGSLAAQALVSAYQRLGLRRSLQRRAEFVARRRAALQKQQEEAAAAETAKAEAEVQAKRTGDEEGAEAAQQAAGDAATAPGSQN